MALSRDECFAILDMVQACELYRNTDIVSLAHKLKTDAGVALYVSQKVMRLPVPERVRILGAALEYERQRSAAA